MRGSSFWWDTVVQLDLAWDDTGLQYMYTDHSEISTN